MTGSTPARAPLPIRAVFRLGMLALAAHLIALAASRAGEQVEWQPVVLVRLENIDAIDANDGELANFVRNIRNDGRFPPPVRNLAGPEIRNPTFFGLIPEAWMECVIMAPSQPGGLRRLWVFQVDSRDEYMLQMASQGLSEYEGMDGVTVLREMDPDGNARTWHLEWLPGDIAVFGADRQAVAAARNLYAEQSASRGLLAQAAGRYVQPDIIVRFDPARFVAWQPDEFGVYWWRERIGKLTTDLIQFWQPGTARSRLLTALSEELIAWPRLLGLMQANIWLEEDGIEWRLEVGGNFRPAVPASNLEALRRLPERAAQAYAVSISPASFDNFGSFAGRLLLGAAGGVVTAEARAAAETFFAALRAAGPDQFASAWIVPPTNRPELGGARMIVARLADGNALGIARQVLLEALQANTPASNALAQMGVRVDLYPDDGDPLALDIVIAPVNDGREPYYNAYYVLRQRGEWLAIVGGPNRDDGVSESARNEYRTALADAAVDAAGPGSPEAREAFTRMGAYGAAFIGMLDPVRFMQLALVENADWRMRTPDQEEPDSTQMAREMLEYGSGGAWSAVGESADDVWRFNGGMSWESLTRLSMALGITEAMNLNVEPPGNPPESTAGYGENDATPNETNGAGQP